ncbi:PREDICTED: uncharacterized protein LOC104596407 [Nelumbo nucifera]|uniref:Uncharacterized protein LOC104596407 n=1 Tax=Nelumbo nucifera TaxID=4432 RepID=A0A1U8A2G7_NELNU|nr:PREDICTED: uncharacterized protein LOC104596407 [Nelumbo nucifera]
MAELCLKAYFTYSSGLFRQEQGLYRVVKEFQPFVQSSGARQLYLHTKPIQIEDPWKPTSWFLHPNQSAKLDSSIRRPVLVDLQDVHPDTVLFSFGIAEQCTRHEKILQFLKMGSSEVLRDGLCLSLLSDLIGLQMAINFCPNRLVSLDDFCPYKIGVDIVQPCFVQPNEEFQKPILDLVGNLAHTSKIMDHPKGRIMLAGNGAEMKDLLSTVVEFYMSKSSTKYRKQSNLVPHFPRLERSEYTFHGSSMKLENVTVVPLKSPEKIKRKLSPKKKQGRKIGRERDLYRRNNFYACESLLSLILNKRGKMIIQSLKKSGPELPQLLNQFSAGIAGTGLAVLLSVFCKVVGGRVPFCASKLLNTGLGFGLVWLSWGVNTLRDTIICISKNSNKLGLKEEEMIKRMDRNMNEIFFRAATLMAMAVLRLA